MSTELHKKLEIVRQVSLGISQSQSLTQLYRSLFDSIRKLVAAEYVRILLRSENDPNGGEVIELFDGSPPPGEGSSQYRNPLSHSSILHGESIRVEDLLLAQCHMESSDLTTRGLQSEVSIPLLAGGRLIGALCVASSFASAYTNEDIEALTQLSYTLALAIELHTARTTIQTVRDETRTILDNIGQGFVLVDLDGLLKGAFSHSFKEWIGSPQKNSPIWDWFEPFAPAFAEILEVEWSALKDGTMPPRVVVKHLPTTCKIGSHTIEFNYRPIFEANRLSEILVIADDVSYRLEQEDERQEQHELIHGLKQLKQDRTGFARFIIDAGALINQISDRVPNELIVTHTLKGNAMVVGASSIAEAAHQFESALSENIDVENARRQLLEAWTMYKHRISLIVDAIKLESIELSRTEYENFIDRLHIHAPNLIPEVEAWAWERIEVPLDRLREAANIAADKLRKPRPKVHINTEPLRLDPTIYGPLFTHLTLAIHNAMDHGIEAPELRRQYSKPLEGQLKISVQRFAQDLRIEIQDDGAGVRWASLQKKAIAMGLAYETTRDLEKVLFLASVSTAESVTEISGRGLGLKALKDAALRLGGDVHIASETRKGTCLTVQVPAIAVATVPLQS